MGRAGFLVEEEEDEEDEEEEEEDSAALSFRSSISISNTSPNFSPTILLTPPSPFSTGIATTASSSASFTLALGLDGVRVSFVSFRRPLQKERISLRSFLEKEEEGGMILRGRLVG